MKVNLKTPVSYYGGKQKLVSTILKIIPQHTLYAEPFLGGAAVFFSKEPSDIEVLNDTNKELMNFYRVVQNDFVGLEKEIRITLHSRDLHRKASVIYNNPDLFNEIKRAWAVWVLSSQSFSAIIDGSWGYDKGKNTTTLSTIKGKFLLSSYPSDVLKQYTKAHSWQMRSVEQLVSVNAKSGYQKRKEEVFTANYEI